MKKTKNPRRDRRTKNARARKALRKDEPILANLRPVADAELFKDLTGMQSRNLLEWLLAKRASLGPRYLSTGARSNVKHGLTVTRAYPQIWRIYGSILVGCVRLRTPYRPCGNAVYRYVSFLLQFSNTLPFQLPISTLIILFPLINWLFNQDQIKEFSKRNYLPNYLLIFLPIWLSINISRLNLQFGGSMESEVYSSW